MITNQEYEDYYNSALDSEFEKIIQQLIEVYRDKQNRSKDFKKNRDFRNNLLGIKSSLISDDRYYKDLTEEFKNSRYDYDDFFLEFLDNIVPKLKQQIKEFNFKVVKIEIYNATPKSTLKHIAKYYAHEKFLDLFFPDSYTCEEPGGLTAILEKLRSGKILGNRGRSDINMPIIDATLGQPDTEIESFSLPKANITKGILNAVGTIVQSQTEIESLPLHTVPQSKTGTEPTETIKPTFKAESVQEVFDILKPFFKTEHQSELKHLLKTGDNTNMPLLFQFSGGALCDFFKQLYSGQFLLIAVQAQLEKWIEKNFVYLNKQGKVTIFKLKYVSRFISETKRPAKGKRLIDIENENGKNKIKQLKITNREQNKRF